MEDGHSFEFDCPQYYDFENGGDDSHPEMYFEANDVSALPSLMTPLQERNSQKQFSLDGLKASDFKFIVHDAPFQNTRLSRKNGKSLAKNKKKNEKPRASSSQSQVPDEPETKKSKGVISEMPKPERNPGIATKMKRTMFSFNTTAMNQENKAPVATKRKISSGRTSHRTIPAPFSFQTDKRMKMDPNISVVQYKQVDFVTTLRNNKIVQNMKVTKGPVRPVPDRLLRKRKVDSCKTMAEQVMSFQQQLSTRIKPPTPKGGKGRSPQVTQPVTPHFRVATRGRQTHVISHEQKEEMEAEEMKKYHFKAQPMNPKIFIPFGMKACKSVEKPKTIPMRLLTEQRAKLKPRSKSLERPPEFHARPVPTRILQGVTGLGKKVVSKSTEPHTPNFALKKREEGWKQQEEEARQREAEAAAAQEEAQLKAQRPLRRRSQSHDEFMAPKEPKKTIPAPFSFFERDQTTLVKKEEKIQQLVEEERKLREFRANPMPSPVVSGLPPLKRKSSTKFVGFSLELDQRARSKALKWEKEIEEQLKRQKEAIVFKAKPCTVTKSEPFMPLKAAKQPTEFLEFSLHTDSRAARRDKYDEELRLKEEQKQSELRVREEVLKEEEAKEIAKLRANAVHKANPVPHYQPFEVKRNLIKPTQPVTPNFETDRRLRRKSK